MLLKFDRPKQIVLIPANMPMSWFDKIFGRVRGKYYIKCDGVDDGVFCNEAVQFLPKNPGGKIWVAQGVLNNTTTTTIDRPNVHYEGVGGAASEINMATANTPLFIVTDDKATFSRLRMVGPGYTEEAGEDAIWADAPDAAHPYIGLKVKGCEIESWGHAGMDVRHIHDIQISRTLFKDIYADGFLGRSIIGGYVSYNTVENIVGSPAYGIALTRANIADLAAHPHCTDVLVACNIVRDVTNWEGISAHAGDRIKIIFNLVKGCVSGIVATYTWYSTKDVEIAHNTVDSGVDDGSGGEGINVTGMSSTDLASGSVIDNTVLRCGDESAATGRAMYFRRTKGLIVNDNLIIEPSPNGMLFDYENYDFSAKDNKIVDPWSETIAGPVAINIYGEKNTGFIGGNTFASIPIGVGGKNATFLLTSAAGKGIFIANHATNVITLGINRSDATTLISDAGRRVIDSVLPANLSIGEFNLLGNAVTIADDDVYSFTPGKDKGIILVYGRHVNYAHYRGMFSYKVAVGHYMQAIVATANMETGTGPLAPGAAIPPADGNVAVYANDADGKIYIKNRWSTPVTISLGLVLFGL